VRAAGGCIRRWNAEERFSGCGEPLQSTELDLLYVSPSGWAAGDLLDRLGQHKLALFRNDEAHASPKWGHDFRPDYLQSSELAGRFPAVPGCTHRPPRPRTRAGSWTRLGLEGERVFTASFDRPNIRLPAANKDDAKRAQLLAFLGD